MTQQDRAAMVASLEDAVSLLSGVTSKRMFGADGFANGGKVFCMVTKDSKMAFKFDEEELYERMVEDYSAKGWNPKGKGRFGNWLALPEKHLEDANTILEWAALAHGTV